MEVVVSRGRGVHCERMNAGLMKAFAALVCLRLLAMEARLFLDLKGRHLEVSRLQTCAASGAVEHRVRTKYNEQDPIMMAAGKAQFDEQDLNMMAQSKKSQL
eukprot:1157764-Pelagomonas_calceolata.AAC.5